MSSDEEKERFYTRPEIVLDLAGLSEQQRHAGSIFLGGSAAEFVEKGDDLAYGDVSCVVWKWGDPKIADEFAKLHEHIQEPADEFFRFSAATIIDDQIWMLVLQDRDFDPRTAYEHESHYQLIPDDLEGARAVLAEMVTRPHPWPELLGRVGNRYLLFEMATNVNALEIDVRAKEFEIAQSTGEGLATIKGEDIFVHVEALINNWNFEKSEAEDSARLALQCVHWLMETFGQKRSDGQSFHVFPGGEDSEIAGQDMPSELQHLITSVFHDGTYLQNENRVWLETTAEYLDTETIIPEWDEMMAGIGVFDKIFEKIKNNSEILAGIVWPKIEVMPVLKMQYEPKFFFGWGLQFLMDPYGVKVSVFGKPNQTWEATNFVVENAHKQKFWIELAFKLALIGIRNSQEGRHFGRKDFDRGVLDGLSARLNGEERIPLNIEEYQGRPDNALKNQMLEELLKAGLIEPPKRRDNA